MKKWEAKQRRNSHGVGFRGCPCPSGTPAPDLLGTRSRMAAASLFRLHGKNVVLVFYPADDTRVCTVQLCEFRDRWRERIQAQECRRGLREPRAQSRGASRSFAKEVPSFRSRLLIDRRPENRRRRIRLNGWIVPRRTVYLIRPGWRDPLRPAREAVASRKCLAAAA